MKIIKNLNFTAGLSFILLIGVCLSSSGCSVVMAAKQPGKKDLTVLDRGTPRANVIGELGTPKWSEEENGKKVDIFTFVQGYSTGAKVGSAAFHGVADVFSFGLWEVVGTPTEAIFDGTEMKVKVVYDGNEMVESVEYLNQSSQQKGDAQKPSTVMDTQKTQESTDQSTQSQNFSP